MGASVVLESHQYSLAALLAALLPHDGHFCTPTGILLLSDIPARASFFLSFIDGWTGFFSAQVRSWTMSSGRNFVFPFIELNATRHAKFGVLRLRVCERKCENLVKLLKPLNTMK